MLDRFQSNLVNFQVWVGTLSAMSGSAPRPITAYLNGGPQSDWLHVWSGCADSVTGNVNSTFPVKVGTTSYHGDILQAVVWKGVELSYVSFARTCSLYYPCHRCAPCVDGLLG